jgi:hypothetical protein
MTNPFLQHDIGEEDSGVAARREYATQAHANSRIEGFVTPDEKYLANVRAYIEGSKSNEEILAELIAEYSEPLPPR